MNYEWQCKGSKIISRNISCYQTSEQECHFYISRNSNKIEVSCNNQIILTKLKKNPYFKIKEMVVNKDNKVLDVLGELPKNFLTIRKKHLGKQQIRGKDSQ